MSTNTQPPETTEEEEVSEEFFGCYACSYSRCSGECKWTPGDDPEEEEEEEEGL